MGGCVLDGLFGGHSCFLSWLDFFEVLEQVEDLVEEIARAIVPILLVAGVQFAIS